MFRGVFIDDKLEEKQYADHLSGGTPPKLIVEFQQPLLAVEDLAEKLIASHFEFAALDFRLDEVPIKGEIDGLQKNKYRASALAQQIRDRVINDFRIDLPLILLSQEDVIKQIFRADKTAEDLFDLHRHNR